RCLHDGIEGVLLFIDDSFVLKQARDLGAPRYGVRYLHLRNEINDELAHVPRLRAWRLTSAAGRPIGHRHSRARYSTQFPILRRRRSRRGFEEVVRSLVRIPALPPRPNFAGRGEGGRLDY